MLIFNKNMITSAIRLPLLATLLLSGCAQLYDFPMGESYRQVKQVQILDPGAPERNEGIVLPLEGNYGRAVMQEYRKSNSAPKEARGKISSGEIGG